MVIKSEISVRFRRFFLIIFCVRTLFFTGCHEKKEARHEDANQEATRLIDLGRSEEAIQLLEKHLQSEPKDLDGLVTLSSAYAHRAGIRFTNFYGLIRQINQQLQNTKSNSAPAAGNTSVETLFKEISWNLGRIILFTKAFEAIPSIEEKNKDHLKYALQLLRSREAELRPKDKAFRVLLRAVAIKHGLTQLNERALPKESAPNEPNQRCYVNLRAVDEHINEPGKELMGLFADLSSVQPPQAESFQRSAKDVGEAIVRINELFSQLSLLNDASQLLARSSLVNAGTDAGLNFLPAFGQIILCRN